MTTTTKATLSVKEAAAEMGCHEQTVYRMVRDGLLPVVRMPSRRSASGVSPRLRFRRADLDRLLAAWTERESA